MKFHMKVELTKLINFVFYIDYLFLIVSKIYTFGKSKIAKNENLKGRNFLIGASIFIKLNMQVQLDHHAVLILKIQCFKVENGKK